MKPTLFRVINPESPYYEMTGYLVRLDSHQRWVRLAITGQVVEFHRRDLARHASGPSSAAEARERLRRERDAA